MQSPDWEDSSPMIEVRRETSQAVPSVPLHVLAAVSHVSRVRSEESWVEVSSRPSSSSLSSSSAAADDIVTTGLRVQPRHPRRLRHRGPLVPSTLRSGPPGSRSSQDEYDETESDEDRVMTSSNEHLPSTPAELVIDSTSPSSSARSDEGDASDGDDDDDDDDDENATALGVTGQGSIFTPQPNVFSHPPRSQPPTMALPSRHPRRQGPMNVSAARRPQHSPYHLMAPSHQTDHDAALRASLSTLLSCAAAVRGLPKQLQLPTRSAPDPAVIEPKPSRIMPEPTRPGGELVGEDELSNPSRPPRPSRHDSPPEREPPSARDGLSPRTKGKRKLLASPVKTGKDARVIKKARWTLEESVAPSLLTWVLSAGVVVLVSAISFSAGYAMGKEVGQAEGSMIDLADGPNCGREAVRGLKRFRWSAGRTGTAVV